MAFQIGGQLAKVQQVLAREQSCLGPGRIQNRCGMPLRQHEAVGRGVRWIGRDVPHLAEEQDRHEVCGGAARRWMPASRLSGGSNRIDAQTRGNVLQRWQRDRRIDRHELLQMNAGLPISETTRLARSPSTLLGTP
jgi:hypothetical protein